MQELTKTLTPRQKNTSRFAECKEGKAYAFILGKDFGQNATTEEEKKKAVAGLQSSAYRWGSDNSKQTIVNKIRVDNKVTGLEIQFNAVTKTVNKTENATASK